MQRSSIFSRTASSEVAPVVLAHSVTLEAGGAREAGPGPVAALGTSAAVAAAAALSIGVGRQGWSCM